MKMEIELRDGGRVDARFGTLVVETGQDGSVPSPFDLFLASIGTCAGFYVGRFCEGRGIAPDGIRIRQTATRDPETRMVTGIEIEIDLPASFPARYADAVVRAAGACAVKKHLAAPPRIGIRANPAG